MKLSSLLVLAASTNADRSERRPRSPKLEGWMGKKNHVMTRKQYVSMYEPQQNPDTFLDDFEYSAEQIRNMVNNGLDIDIARLFPNFDEEARGTIALNYARWPKNEDGQVVIPFSFQQHFSKKAEFRKHIEEMSANFGCITFEYVPTNRLLDTNHENGLLITHASTTLYDNGCKSAMGRLPGYTSDNGSIELMGAKPGWQLIIMDDYCMTRGTVQHEMMHALSIKHEHVRGDRDELLLIDLQQIQNELPGFEYNFYKIEDENWGKAQWPFDFRSVMNYPSKIGSKVLISTHSGQEYLRNNVRHSSTDALQLQWLYCAEEGTIEDYEYTPWTNCESMDPFGYYQPILKSRICDGIKDCFDGEDEDGRMGDCNKHGKEEDSTDDGCCRNIFVVRYKTRYQCQESETSPKYNDHVMYDCFNPDNGKMEEIKLFWETSLHNGEGAGWVFGFPECASTTKECEIARAMSDNLDTMEGKSSRSLNMWWKEVETPRGMESVRMPAQGGVDRWIIGDLDNCPPIGSYDPGNTEELKNFVVDFDNVINPGDFVTVYCMDNAAEITTTTEAPTTTEATSSCEADRYEQTTLASIRGLNNMIKEAYKTAELKDYKKLLKAEMGICKNSDKLLAKSLGKSLKGCEVDFIGVDTLNSFSSSLCGFIPGTGQHEVTQLRNICEDLDIYLKWKFQACGKMIHGFADKLKKGCKKMEKSLKKLTAFDPDAVDRNLIDTPSVIPKPTHNDWEEVFFKK